MKKFNFYYHRKLRKWLIISADSLLIYSRRFQKYLRGRARSQSRRWARGKWPVWIKSQSTAEPGREEDSTWPLSHLI